MFRIVYITCALFMCKYIIERHMYITVCTCMYYFRKNSLETIRWQSLWNTTKAKELKGGLS